MPGIRDKEKYLPLLTFALGPLEVSVRYFWILPDRTENTEMLVFSVRSSSYIRLALPLNWNLNITYLLAAEDETV